MLTERYEWIKDDNGNYSYVKAPARKKTSTVKNAVIASLVTSIVCMTVYGIFVVPKLRPSTVFSYSNHESDKYKMPDSDSPDKEQLEFLADRVSASVVTVQNKGTISSFFSQMISLGDGTGVIISDDGYILTNSYIIESSGTITVTLSDKREYDAAVIGVDSSTHTAILKIEESDLVPAVLGNSDELIVGDTVYAMGMPLGAELGVTVTSGLVCGINKDYELSNGRSISFFQTDAPVGSTTAGYTVFNLDGELVGMVTDALSTNVDGLSLAIPVNDIKTVVESILGGVSTSNGVVIGITGFDADYGVVVDKVGEGTPAEKAGIVEGDLIIKVDGRPVNSMKQINEIRDLHQKGETMVFTVYRKGDTEEIELKL